jgi:hypothetical protein
MGVSALHWAAVNAQHGEARRSAPLLGARLAVNGVERAPYDARVNKTNASAVPKLTFVPPVTYSAAAASYRKACRSHQAQKGTMFRVYCKAIVISCAFIALFAVVERALGA